MWSNDGRKRFLTPFPPTEVSDVVGRGEKSLPVITRRTAKSTVRVQDGGTAAVAGLMLSRSRLAESGVPGAARLPGVGQLFRSDTDSKSSRQLAIFVTARLMPDGDEKSIKPRERPTIKPAGKEFQEQLRESLRLAEKGNL
jgi:type II secretory pathway component GspD/PulD (secretin)